MASTIAAIAGGQLVTAGAASAIVPSAACDAVAANLIQDCGFESDAVAVPPSTPWVVTPASSGSDLVVSSASHSGSRSLTFAAVNSLDDTVSQSFTTTAGVSYQLSFFLGGSAVAQPGHFTATVDGTTVSGMPISANPTSYAEYDQDFTAAGSSATVTFAGYDATGSISLDDVVVVPRPVVTFDAQGGSPTPAAQAVDPGGLATAPADPSKAGVVFDGWSASPTGSAGPWSFATDAVTADLTLYAIYSTCDGVSGNLVQNCGFEADPPATIVPTGWTLTKATDGGSDVAINKSSDAPHSGFNQYSFGATGDSGTPASDDSLSQVLATTPGSTYDVSFVLASLVPNDSDEGGNGPDFCATVQGTASGDVVLDCGHMPNAFPYLQVQGSFTAGAGDATLLFAAADTNDWFDLDDVVVTAHPVSSVPYPPPTPTVTVTSSENPSRSGDAVTFTAAVSPAPVCGTVTWFVDGAQPPSGTPVGGTGDAFTLGPISSLAVGAHNVVAVYSGCATAGSANGEVNQEVAPSSPPPRVMPPSIAATESGPPNAYGWWNRPVIVSFTCAPGSSPYATSCPQPVTVSKDGVGQKVTGTVTDTDGGTASVTVTIDLDQQAPTLQVAGAKDGATYHHARHLTCVGVDVLSGMGSCVIHRHRHNAGRLTTVRWMAVATDVAGNETTEHGSYLIKHG